MTGVVPAERGTSPAEGPLLLVTRPAVQAADWVQQLRALGCRAQALPLIAIGPAPDAAALAAMLASLRPDALVMFVSPNAVLQSFAALPAGTRWPGGVRAAATGPGTVAALREAGVPAAQIVAPATASGRFDSEALWELLAHEHWVGRPVWIVRGEGGRDWFAETLGAAGAEVHFVQGYSRSPARLQPAEQLRLDDALRHPADTVWLLSSSEAVDHLRLLAPGADWSAARAMVSHPRIAARAQALGFGDIRLVTAGVASVVDALRPSPGAA